MRGLVRLLRAGRWVVTCGLWAGLGLAAGLIAAVVLPALAGWRSLAVMSGSMEPTIATGDVVVTRPIAPLAARVGDVVTFHDPTRGGRLVTHRVRRIRVSGRSVEFETKGDANNSWEQWAVPLDGRIGVKLTYTGSLPSTVKLYASAVSALANYINLTITPGTGGPTFPGCSGFTPDAGGAVYTGTLKGFTESHNSYDTGLADNPGGATAWVANDTVVYQFALTLQDDNAANGGATPLSTGLHSFTWQARNQ